MIAYSTGRDGLKPFHDKCGFEAIPGSTPSIRETAQGPGIG